MNIYVGNLSSKVTNDLLRSTFEAFGEVKSAKVILDHVTGQTRGFGFVIMNTDEEAQASINGLNGKDLEGQRLNVNEARPLEPRTSTGSGRPPFGDRRSGPSSDRGGRDDRRGGSSFSGNRKSSY